MSDNSKEKFKIHRLKLVNERLKVENKILKIKLETLKKIEKVLFNQRQI